MYRFYLIVYYIVGFKDVLVLCNRILLVRYKDILVLCNGILHSAVQGCTGFM